MTRIEATLPSLFEIPGAGRGFGLSRPPPLMHWAAVPCSPRVVRLRTVDLTLLW